MGGEEADICDVDRPTKFHRTDHGKDKGRGKGAKGQRNGRGGKAKGIGKDSKGKDEGENGNHDMVGNKTWQERPDLSAGMCRSLAAEL